MNAYIAVLSAASALLGTIIGGVISYFTTRYTITQQHRHDQRMREIEKRESLYSDFLAEVTRLTLLSIDKKASGAADFVLLSNLQARIKLLASNEVGAAAGEMTSFTVKKFSNIDESKGNKEDEKLPLRFIEIARNELEELKNRIC
jgi:hypothetical protein